MATQPLLTIDQSEIQPFIYRSANVGDSGPTLIPHVDALTGVQVLARSDGFFVFELTIDPQKGFDPADVDELAHVVSMVAKSRLGHTHYHHNMPGKGRATALRPSQILHVSPVQLAPDIWPARVRDGRFDDGDLRGGEAVAPSGSDPSALLELRHRFIRIEDTLNFRIRSHRSTQAKRGSGWLVIGSYIFWALIAAGMTFLIVLPDRHDVGPRDIAAFLTTLVFIVVALRLRQRIARWDVPVIRLLRTAHGFLSAADPLNRVCDRLLRRGRHPLAVDDFSNLLSNLESRIEGEQHRIGMGQNWLALAVGGASLVAAISALKHTDGQPARTVTPAVAPAPEPPAPLKDAPSPAAVAPGTQPAMNEQQQSPAAHTRAIEQVPTNASGAKAATPEGNPVEEDRSAGADRAK